MTIVNNREDIVIAQKETFVWKFNIINPDDGNYVNLTNVNAINLQARKYTGASEAILDLSLGSEIIVTNPSTGEVTITITSDTTSDFDFKYIYYDLFYSLDGVVFIKYKKGIISLERSITS